MNSFLHQLSLSAPLFAMVGVGYAVTFMPRWPKNLSARLTQVVFMVVMPAMLFRIMSKLSALPPVDSRLLLAFFGSCLIVFAFGRVVGRVIFKFDGVSQSVFALGGVFSNNVLLGLPLAKISLGEASVPSVALVLVFNALTLWTLVSVSVEWARHGSPSLVGFAKTAKGVATNPIVASIVGGALFGLTGLTIPEVIDQPLALLGQAAAPLALVALGMGLSEHRIGANWEVSLAICTIKLLVQPFVVWCLAQALGLPTMETHVVVLLSSLSVGVNVYVMARQFKTLEGPVAASLVVSTGLATVTTTIVLALMGSNLE